jgi:hypothetical protein
MGVPPFAGELALAAASLACAAASCCRRASSLARWPATASLVLRTSRSALAWAATSGLAASEELHGCVAVVGRRG